jgi:hypothetical protein
MSRLDLGHLSPDEWERLEGMAAHFEAACQGAGSVNLADFLPVPGDPLRGIVLQELVKTDLEIRWRNGKKVVLEEYLARFPELGSAASVPAALVYEEYRVRQLYGDRPSLADYECRFPGQVPEVRKRVPELHQQSAVPKPVANEPPEPPPAAGPFLSVAPTKIDPAAGRPPAPPDHILPAGTPYKLLDCLGQGSFAEVFRGEAPGGIPVAIKRVIKPIDRKEAQRELQSLELIKTLRHPFLLATHSFWMSADRLFIVMELADGTLRDRLRECARANLPGIPLDELVTYVGQAARALDFLHGREVLHRDIKPENILLVSGYVKVGDFGLARGVVDAMQSVTGAGTPRYMAPEVWRGQASRESDQYSLALSYLDLRGHWPFSGQNMADMLMAHLYGEPDLGPLPAAEQDVLRRALAKEPARRYPSCRAFADALHEAVPQPGARPAAGPPLQAADAPTMVPGQFTPAAPPAPVAEPAAQLPDSSAVVAEEPPAADSDAATASGSGDASSSELWVPLAVPEPADDAVDDGELVPVLDRSNVAATQSVPSTALASSPAAPAAGPALTTASHPVAHPPQGPLRWLVTPVLFVLLLLTVAGLAWSLFGRRPGPAPPPFTLVLEKLDGLTLKAGEAKSVAISVQRSNYTGPIRLDFPELPRGILISDVTIPENSAVAEVRVSAFPDADEGDLPIAVAARADRQPTRQEQARISVRDHAYTLPGGWQKPAEAQPVWVERKCYYSCIDVVRGGIAVQFILIPAGQHEELLGPDSVPTFYMMRDKVWVALFRAFANEARPPLKNTTWRTPEKVGWSGINEDEDQPVMGVVLADAHACAAWLGGFLPLPRQWDKAAGRWSRGRGDGPFEQKFSGEKDGIAVNVECPVRRGGGRYDRSVFGLRDMAGNGQELTDSISAESGDAGRIMDPAGYQGSVTLRASRWNEGRPFRFSDLDPISSGHARPRAQGATEANDGTGFRVVLEM